MGHYRWYAICFTPILLFNACNNLKKLELWLYFHFTKEEIWLVLANPGINSSPELLIMGPIFSKELALAKY